MDISPSTCCSVSNSAGFERCVRSPVCSTNDGCSGAALIFALAARSVAVTSAFAGLSKPMWLSLICTKRRPLVPLIFIAPRAACSIGIPFSTPLVIVHMAPVPTHAMLCRNPRRSQSLSSFFVTHASLLRAQEVRAPDEPCAEMPRDAYECRRPEQRDPVQPSHLRRLTVRARRCQRRPDNRDRRRRSNPPVPFEHPHVIH